MQNVIDDISVVISLILVPIANDIGVLVNQSSTVHTNLSLRPGTSRKSYMGFCTYSHSPCQTICGVQCRVIDNHVLSLSRRSEARSIHVRACSAVAMP
jgi:hypothetical protein